MKVKMSPLKLLDFALTRMDFSLVPSDNLEEDPRLHFGAYEVDVDFNIYSDGVLRVLMKMEINAGENIRPGYSIKAESVCLFDFDNNSGVSEDAKRSMEGFSTIYIALNCLRGLISSFTANGAFGRYIPPSIDLNDLIETKQLEQQAVADSDITE